MKQKQIDEKWEKLLENDAQIYTAWNDIKIHGSDKGRCFRKKTNNNFIMKIPVLLYNQFQIKIHCTLCDIHLKFTWFNSYNKDRIKFINNEINSHINGTKHVRNKHILYAQNKIINVKNNCLEYKNDAIIKHEINEILTEFYNKPYDTYYDDIIFKCCNQVNNGLFIGIDQHIQYQLYTYDDYINYCQENPYLIPQTCNNYYQNKFRYNQRKYSMINIYQDKYYPNYSNISQY